MDEFELLNKILEILNERPTLKALAQFLSILMLIGGLYRYLLKPSWTFHWKLFDAVDKVHRSFPVLMKMAADFKPNGGTSLRDVVDRIELRQDVEESRVFTLIQSSTNAIFEADASGNWIRVNRAWCEATGFLPEEAIGFGWLNTICTDYQIAVSAQWKLALDQRRDCILEFNLVTKKDIEIPAKIEASAIRSRGQVQGYIGRLILLPSIFQTKLGS